MKSGRKILITIAAVIVSAAAIGVLVGYFHIPQTFASVGVGVVVGMGVALGALSLTPKRSDYN